MRKIFRLSAITALACIPLVGCSDDDLQLGPIGGFGGDAGSGGSAGSGRGGTGGSAIAGSGGLGGSSGSAGTAGTAGTGGTGNECALTECGTDCVDPQTTAAHCGVCDRACSNANASGAACGSGLCSATCNTGFADCNVDDGTGADDGCETDLNQNATCGTSCGTMVACQVGEFCVSGACTATCSGTECGDACVALPTSSDHCNACDRACSSASVETRACVAGHCAPSCNAGFGDCSVDDGTGADDGCETELDVSEANCGACGRACSNANTTDFNCVASLCVPECANGFGDCSVDDGLSADDGCETELEVSEENCGTCGRACSDANTTDFNCVANRCVPECTAGFADCSLDDGLDADDGCETNLNANVTCGTTCENKVVCGDGEFCVDGACTATCDDTVCGAACVDTATSVTSCGACDRACDDSNTASLACNGGACEPTCTDGFGDCNADSGAGADGGGADDGCETDFSADESCGTSCGDVESCDIGESCNDGVCTPDCLADQCGAECVDTDVTEEHCGACDRACSNSNASATACNSGLCSATCNAGFADCSTDDGTGADDGCETAIDTDAVCGTTCGNVVACGSTQGCVSGACVPLITNSTFEAGLAPWAASFGGTIAVTTEQAHSGLQSAKVSNRTATYQGAFYNLTGLVTQGASYSVSLFGRIGGAATGNLTLTAHRVCNGADGFAGIQSVTGSSTAWTELANTFTVPTTTACPNMTRFEIYLESTVASVDIYIDDVVLNRL